MNEKPTPVTELLQLCANDYKNGAPQRTADHRDDAHLVTYTPAPSGPDPREPLYGQDADHLRWPTTLDTAIRVAQQMLDHYGDSSRDGFTYPEAYGATREALRLVLRALGTEPAAASITSASPEATHCPAAHPEDPTPCDGPHAVTILDADNAGADGCEHHGARLLASLDGARVYALPDAPHGAAIRTFKAAAALRPFPWLTDAPRTRPEQLSHDENRARGEGQ